MATKFFVDADGNYIGGFDGVEPPNGAIEVPYPPDTHASQLWNGEAYEPYIPIKPLAEKLNEIFQAQTPEVRAQFGPFKAAVKDFLEEDDTLAALATINGAQVSEELAPVKDQMLSLFE